MISRGKKTLGYPAFVGGPGLAEAHDIKLNERALRIFTHNVHSC